MTSWLLFTCHATICEWQTDSLTDVPQSMKWNCGLAEEWVSEVLATRLVCVGCCSMCWVVVLIDARTLIAVFTLHDATSRSSIVLFTAESVCRLWILLCHVRAAAMPLKHAGTCLLRFWPPVIPRHIGIDNTFLSFLYRVRFCNPPCNRSRAQKKCSISTRVVDAVIQYIVEWSDQPGMKTDCDVDQCPPVSLPWWNTWGRCEETLYANLTMNIWHCGRLELQMLPRSCSGYP